MLLSLLKSSPLFRRFFLSKTKKWSREKAERFIHYLKKNSSVIDIGCGNGLLAKHLTNLGFRVAAIDVANHSIIDTIKPIVYDGKSIPFPEQSFDYALLITVLHHSEDPITVLSEAKRIANHIIIIEDTYKNIVQKYLTLLTDTIVNFGHSKMTYQNKSETGWENTFNDLGLRIEVKKNKRVLLFFQQTTYLLKAD